MEIGSWKQCFLAARKGSKARKKGPINVIVCEQEKAFFGSGQ